MVMQRRLVPARTPAVAPGALADPLTLVAPPAPLGLAAPLGGLPMLAELPAPALPDDVAPAEPGAAPEESPTPEGALADADEAAADDVAGPVASGRAGLVGGASGGAAFDRASLRSFSCGSRLMLSLGGGSGGTSIRSAQPRNARFANTSSRNMARRLKMARNSRRRSR